LKLCKSFKIFSKIFIVTLKSVAATHILSLKRVKSGAAGNSISPPGGERSYLPPEFTAAKAWERRLQTAAAGLASLLPPEGGVPKAVSGCNRRERAGNSVVRAGMVTAEFYKATRKVR
jgi:hypothetical protein